MDMDMYMVEQIIENGVKNLKEFGYKNVDEENILTDFIFASFFKRMLEDSLGKGFDNEINEILKKIDKEIKSK